MRVLPDTNAFLRWPGGKAFPHKAERALSRQDTELVVSIVTAWEILLKSTLGVTSADVQAGIGAMGALVLPIRFAHLEELHGLPLHEDHRDPFDRLLIAQAISEHLSIISSDTRFPEYKQLRVLWD